MKQDLTRPFAPVYNETNIVKETFMAYIDYWVPLRERNFMDLAGLWQRDASDSSKQAEIEALIV